MIPITHTLANLDCSRGAPMGRPELHRLDLQHDEIALHLQYTPLDQGYDQGGAYWGVPSNLYRAFNIDQGIQMFIRANNRVEAEKAVRKIYRKAEFVKLTRNDLTDFTKGYVHAALWSSSDEEGTPLNQTTCTVPDSAYEAILETCWDFQETNAELLKESGLAEAAQGHDFWLTRNGHGAGFWDRGLGEVGVKLTQAAKTYGGVDLWINDEGEVHGW